MLQANLLTKIYADGVPALDRLDLSVRDGEVFVCWDRTARGRRPQ
ncbi:MAG: hypothetical protein FD138_4607 [Planctomycetota bacterium]|nr:MAG: hypothetical protein FD138_4607 [Planctomycetota bacterium]